MRENEFETLAMIIEHLESIEEMAWNKSMYYFNKRIYGKSLIFEGLSERTHLEILMLENFIKDYDVRKESKEHGE